MTTCWGLSGVHWGIFNRVHYVYSNWFLPSGTEHHQYILQPTVHRVTPNVLITSDVLSTQCTINAIIYIVK